MRSLTTFAALALACVLPFGQASGQTEPSGGEDDLAPYLRIGSWDGSLSPRVTDTQRDVSTLADLFRRFDIVAIHNGGQRSTYENVVELLNTTTDVPWGGYFSQDENNTSAIFWREDRVFNDGYLREMASLSPRAVRPMQVGRFRYGSEWFFLINVSFTSDPSSESHMGVIQLTDLVRTLKMRAGGEPVFAAASLRADHNDEALATIRAEMVPVVTDGEGSIAENNRTKTNIWTTLTRATRSGYYPYYKAMALNRNEAEARVGRFLPVFSLVDLSE